MGVEQYSLVAHDWLNLEFIINDLASRVIGQGLSPISEPTFAELTLTGFTASRLVASDANKGLVSSDLIGWVDTGSTDRLSVTDDADGTITLDLGVNTQTLLGSFNGIFLEKLDFTITEAGGTVTGTLEQDTGGDLIQKFSDGYTTLDCTPAKTIDLTAYVGTDAVPKEVFIYILQSAKTTIVASNVDWPLDPEVEHIKIAHLVLKSATTTGTDGGALMNQNHNDYAFDATGEGHLQDIEHRLRQEPTQYHSGVALTLKNAAGAALTTGNSSTAVELVTATGHIFQIHQHNFPAFDMYTVATDKADIVNQPADEGGNYETTVDLVTDITHYVDGTAAGVAIGVNKYFNIVIWGVMNRSGETSFLMINLPTGQYTTSANAVADVDGTSIFEIPSAFKGTGFLIARLTFRLIGGAQWTYIAQEDLRGKFPDIIAGVGITTTDHALLANLTAPADDHTQYLLASGTRALAGAWDMGSQVLTNVNIDSGVITGITDLAIADGGTGQSTAQAAINALSAVSGATNEHVLTKDTGTGNAIFKAATFVALTDTPANYTGSAGKYTKVNAGENALEFDIPDGAGILTSRCSVYLSGNQSITSGFFVKVQFDIELYDSDGEFDNAVNYRFTATNSGYYQVDAAVSYDSVGDGKVSQVSIYKNNNTHLAAPIHVMANASDKTVVVSKAVYLAATDFIELLVFQNSGGNRNILGGVQHNTYMTIHRIANSDEKVKIDAAATAGYLGAANNDGILRTGAGLSYTDGGDFITIGYDINSLVADGSPDGAADYVVTYDADAGSHKKVLLDNIGGGGGSGYIGYIKLSDVKAQNTGGGTFTSGAWQTRILNTEDFDTNNDCSLSSNQITLAAGTYECQIRCPGNRVGRHQCRLYNVTDAALLLLGSNSFSSSSASYASNSSSVVGRFTIAASKAIEVQHYCQVTRGTDGFGDLCNFTSEVYTVAEFWRVS